MCWCAPRQCHALSIAKVVAERAESACRLPSYLCALVGVLISRELVCLLVRRSLLSLGPGAERSSHYLGGGSPLRLPPRAELRGADEERTRVSRGSADLVRDHASRLRIRII
eukprot:scaffold6858_cov112-Isochrysis_galbana.AAC.6